MPLQSPASGADLLYISRSNQERQSHLTTPGYILLYDILRQGISCENVLRAESSGCTGMIGVFHRILHDQGEYNMTYLCGINTRPCEHHLSDNHREIAKFIIFMSRNYGFSAF